MHRKDFTLSAFDLFKRAIGAETYTNTQAKNKPTKKSAPKVTKPAFIELG